METKTINVLYLETDEKTIETTTSYLQYLTKNIFCAKSISEATKIINEEHIDLCLINNEFDNFSGLEFLEKIQQDRIIPTIFIFEEKFNKFKELSKLYDIKAFFIKPYNIENFLMKVYSIVREYNKIKISKENEKLLIEYKKMVDQTLAVSKTNTEGKITYVNQKFSQLCGYSKEELIGSTHSIVRHIDTPKETIKNIWETVINKKIWKGIIKNKNKSGDFYFVAVTIVPIENVLGEISEFISLQKDITSEIIQQDKLTHQTHIKGQYEEKINEVLYIYRFDLDFNILYANHKAKYFVDYLDKKYTNKAELVNSILYGKLPTFDIQLKKRHFNFSIKVLKDKNNKPSEIMFIGKDISEVFFLTEEIESTQNEIILTLAKIGEMHSEETGNHIQRVAEYSFLLAKLFGLSAEECEIVRKAAPLHDIGKIAIKDSIIHKPGALDSCELSKMKQHPVFGYEFFKSSKRPLLEAAAIIAYQHHEKWNGTGYPRGLKEEEIHIFGRIVALADVFDALSVSRAYKEAWSLEKILSFFQQERGEHFDPYLIDLFFENLEDFIAIKNSFV